MAKRKRSSRRRRASATRTLRSVAITLAAVAFLGVVGLKWATSNAGQRVLADWGVVSAQAAMTQRIHQALLEALQTAGISTADVGLESPKSPSGPTTVRVDCAQPLLDLNIVITQTVNRVGGHVYHGRRIEADGSATLELHIGTRRLFTHRVLLHRGEQRVQPPPLPRGRLALVIDDWGHNLGPVARRILAVDHPLTLAVLPELPFSRRILTEARRRGKRTILHLPMEPEVAQELPPDEPAVRVGMPPAEIEALTARLLDGLDGVDGINNHMGSRATRHRPEMEAVLRVVARRGLLFLDSVTSRRSVAYQVAREMGVPALRNDLFLDNDSEDPQIVTERLLRLVQMARADGVAVGIGHVNEGVATALEQVLPELDPSDVALVFLSDLTAAPAP